MNKPISHYNEVDQFGTTTVEAEKEDAFICQNDSIKSFLIALSAKQGFNWLSRHGKGELKNDMLLMLLKEALYQIEQGYDADSMIDNIFDELPEYLEEYLEDD